VLLGRIGRPDASEGPGGRGGAGSIRTEPNPQAEAETEADPRPASADALAARFPALTPREREVYALVLQGRSNSEIAETLYVGVATVKTHVNALFAKLGVRDRAQAIARGLGRI